MIFGQRMTVIDPAGDAWGRTQIAYLRAFGVAAKLWTACDGSLYVWAVENWRVFTAMTVGILIGSSALAFLTGNLVFTISYALPLWSVTLFELLQQQGPAVEAALRHLYDCSYLGQQPLAQLQWVQRQQSSKGKLSGLNTHLNVGHALFSLLVDMVDQLRPADALPTSVVIPPREWHPYMILHGSYVQGELTREIMARLYIGEGTYNRTRRRALRSVAKAIQEIEQQITTQGGC
jgi:hypothetical protein